MQQLQPNGSSITLIHFFAYEKYVVRQDQTMMRDSWVETQGHIACMPGMTEFHLTPYHPAYMRTDDPRAVSCPACKRTHEYAKKIERMRNAGIKVDV